jgi:hypothetical protein
MHLHVGPTFSAVLTCVLCCAVLSDRLLLFLSAGLARAQADEFALLPPLRGGDMGWEYVGRKGGARNTFGPGSNSALIGDYRPPEPISKPQPAAAPAAAAKAPAAAPKPKEKAAAISGEDITNRCVWRAPGEGGGHMQVS